MLDKCNFNYSLKPNKGKPLIVFLHGFMGNSQVFDDVIALLGSEFSYLTIDLPGHGKTLIEDSNELYNLPNTARALIELLDSLGITKCFLVGYSMGGRLALYLTLYFPKCFDKVILESSSPGLKTEQERNKRLERDLELAQKLESDIFSDFLSDWYCNPLFSSLKQNSSFPELFAKRLKNNPAQLAISLRNLSTGGQPSLWNKLKHNKVPTRLIVGELDRKFIEINTKMSQLCESFQLHIVKKCGHNIHWENPHQFTRIIGNFFSYH